MSIFKSIKSTVTSLVHSNKNNNIRNSSDSTSCETNSNNRCVKNKCRKKQQRNNDLDRSREEEELETVQNTFSILDEDGDGKISKNELRKFIHLFYTDPTDDELESFLKELDSDGDGYVDIKEFCEFACKNKEEELTKEELETMFNLIATQTNASDTLEKTDVYEFLKKLNLNLTNAQIEEIFSEADLNNDGSINFSEFVRVMTK